LHEIYPWAILLRILGPPRLSDLIRNQDICIYHLCWSFLILLNYISSCVEFVAIETPSSSNVSALEQHLGIKSRAVSKTKGCYKSQEINKTELFAQDRTTYNLISYETPWNSYMAELWHTRYKIHN